MARRRLHRTSEFPYHVVTRTNEQQFFKLPMSKVWKILLRSVAETQIKYQIQTLHIILMSNHLHWTLKTPLENIDLAMKFCLSRTARLVQYYLDLTGHLWGSRYKYSIIDTDNHYRNIVRYGYQNSLRAGVVRQVTRYRFSTLPGYLGKMRLPFELCDEWFKERIANRQEEILTWLNTPVSTAESYAIQFGLRFRKFRLRDRNMP